MFLASPAIAEEPDPELGQQIFEMECQQCHAVGARVIGPDLAGVTERRDEEWLIPFIRNSQAMIREGDEIAVQLFEEYNKMVMPAVDLTDHEIRSVLAHIEAETATKADAGSSETGEATPGAAPAAADQDMFGVNYNTVIVFLSVVLGVLILLFIILFLANRRVKFLLWEKEHPGEAYPEGLLDQMARFTREELFGDMLKRLNPTFGVMSIMGLVFIVVVVILYDRGQYVGSQEGYAPEQPIPFDHSIHAGQHEIDCQYCHTGVEKGKNANIPGLNVCMNCHISIGQDKLDVQKLVEAYENNEPIEWIRIHNLADHAFFSHAQHVAVGNIDCQTCHGPVEEMQKVKQMQNMTMGWCIDCHRETKVDLTNEYYHESFGFVKDHESLTISELGGLECSKCHY